MYLVRQFSFLSTTTPQTDYRCCILYFVTLLVIMYILIIFNCLCVEDDLEIIKVVRFIKLGGGTVQCDLED